MITLVVLYTISLQIFIIAECLMGSAPTYSIPPLHFESPNSSPVSQIFPTTLIQIQQIQHRYSSHNFASCLNRPITIKPIITKFSYVLLTALTGQQIVKPIDVPMANLPGTWLFPERITKLNLFLIIILKNERLFREHLDAGLFKR